MSSEAQNKNSSVYTNPAASNVGKKTYAVSKTSFGTGKLASSNVLTILSIFAFGNAILVAVIVAVILDQIPF